MIAPGASIRRVRLVAPEPGYRFHLHRRGADPRPIEVDPDDFDLDALESRPGSTLLQVSGWVEALGAPVDDRFRRLPPALSPALADRRAVSAALGAPSRGESPDRLDNVAQFRFYSAWRAAVQRRGEP